jgi:AAA+ ATPase superfamily predicted ATPase
MKFTGREKELERLAKIATFAHETGYLTMITGRRRVGKTTLIKQFFDRQKITGIYFFVSRKQAPALLHEFTEILSEFFPEIGGMKFSDFDVFFRFLFRKLNTSFFTFVFDEFQNFQYVDPAVFSILQKYWDENKEKMTGHIIVIGSIQTMMHQIFEDKKEPLFKRLTDKIILKPFTAQETKNLIARQNTTSGQQANLALYLLFNGIPFYYELMEKARLFGKGIIAVIDSLALQHDSLLFNEGKELTIEEFGKNYGRYFSILEAIASGHTQWNKIATQSGVPQNSLGKYLDELLNYYGLIERRSSILSKSTTKTNRYYIRDNFLTFWFRYIFKNYSILEQHPSEYFLPRLKKDLSNFFGMQFERFVHDWLIRQSFIDSNRFPFDRVGNYWDKGQNEIDVVAYQDKGRICMVGECKWNSKRVTSSVVSKLSHNVEIIGKKRHFKEFRKAVFVGDAMPKQQRLHLKQSGILVFDVADLWGD